MIEGIGLKTSGSSAWLDAPAAQSYKRMIADGCPAGGITDAGRTRPQQAALYAAYLAGKLKATAAKPGTSKHETGRALDLAEPARSWVRAHGAAYGWIKDRVRNEPWHMEYLADYDKHAGKTTTAPLPTPTPAPAPEEDDDMVPLIELCYRQFYNREGRADRVAFHADACKGKTHAEVVAYFRALAPEPGSVVRAYRDILGRDPGPSEIADRMSWHKTVGDLFDALAKARAAGQK